MNPMPPPPLKIRKPMDKIKPFLRLMLPVIALSVVWTGTLGMAGAAGDTPMPMPDFTKGGKPDDSHDWLLGPTGAHGWIYGRHGQTAESRQILITAVEAGSPADGILAANDVILAVDGKPFADDARKSIGHAVTAAEAQGGMLRLVRWRDGQTANVELKLPVMGAYGNTAPFDCPKSRMIFEQGCQFIAKQGLNEANIPNDLNALALLASGKEEYRPMLATYAKKVAASLKPGTWTWFYGHGVTFLGEYVLATGDRSMLPELERTAKEAVMGQSAVGTWGHEFYITQTGNLNGYGCMNLPGAMVTIGLVVAREAGVKDPAVDKAIAKSATFLRWYVDKGAVPYGDHQPWPGHEDNGKCSCAAVLFDLLGDGAAASYFARMGLAGYEERERGHTGNFYNLLWALPGVVRCGPLATGAYFKKNAWYYDLARGWRGNFIYQGSPVGEEEHRKYTDWDSTGAYLLTYALPLKSLCLTGRKPCSVKPLAAREVDEAIAAGRDYFSPSGKNGFTYEGRTNEQLLAGLSSWSPAVRKRSARTLGGREGDFLPPLLKMLAGSDRYARYGACEALGFLGSRADAAAPQLRALLKNPDPWLESLACNAIAHLGKEARNSCANDMLALAARENPGDSRGMRQRAVATAMFTPFPGNSNPTILENSLDGVDRHLLYPAMSAVLQNNDAAARGSLIPYLDKLNDQDLAAMLPAIIKAIETMAPSDEMFADGIRQAGLDLLSRRHIREGMDLCVSTIEWRWGNDYQKRLQYLLRYGTHAKTVLPELRNKRPQSAKEAQVFDKFIADIEAATDTPTLISLKDFIASASNR